MENSGAPKRLIFKTYMQLVRGSVGSNMFRHFYMTRADGTEFDAVGDGDNGCAFFVSSVLTIFAKIERIHGTVAKTVEDLQKSGWLEVQTPELGDVLVWAPKTFESGETHAHIGFFVGDGKAVSMSSSLGTPAEHDMYFGDEKRAVTHIFRLDSWEN
ncbi:MAG TPA: hypothetical protein VIM53_00565 [Candidatus Saccharimonadales bacterium]